MPVTPTVAIVGRPNVGKSTLFNRLLGSRRSIVHDVPGVTRDRVAERAPLEDDRWMELIDTGGLLAGAEDPLGLGEQVRLAVEESDLLLLVVDGKDGLLPADERVWEELRPSGKPTILVVNKGDTRAAQESFAEFYRLGITPQLLVSAEHALGTGDLREAIAARLPERPGEQPPEAPAVAIVGRPNVGKSSLVNRILGAPRTLVSERPGTTRDPVDTLIRREGREYLLVDTAGIRRRSRVEGAPEELAVMMARRQIERADAVVLVVDAADGVTTGDVAVAGAVWEAGRPAVVAVNKWDLLDAERRDALEASWPRLAEALAGPPRVNTSALTGRGVARLFPALVEVLETASEPLPTAELNRLVEAAVRGHHPPSERGRPWKVYYATQVSTRPPTFMLFCNRTLPRSSPYRRYLENRLRRELGWWGIPIRLVIRRRTG